MWSNDYLQKKVVFLHIPKTGGTSLHTYLCAHFGQEQVFHALAGTDVYAAANQDFSLYSGHLSWPEVTAIPRRCVLTILRDPVGRVVSEYHYFKSFRDDYLESENLSYIRSAKMMTLTEYLTSPQFVRSTHNPQIRQFLDGNDVSAAGEIREPDCALSKGLKRIDEVDMVGLFEHFDLSIELMNCVLGLKSGTPVPRVNITEQNHLISDTFEKIDRVVRPDHIEAILTNNRLDLKLYEHAKKRFFSLVKERLPERAGLIECSSQDD